MQQKMNGSKCAKVRCVRAYPESKIPVVSTPCLWKTRPYLYAKGGKVLGVRTALFWVIVRHSPPPD